MPQILEVYLKRHEESFARDDETLSSVMPIVASNMGAGSIKKGKCLPQSSSSHFVLWLVRVDQYPTRASVRLVCSIRKKGLVHDVGLSQVSWPPLWSIYELWVLYVGTVTPVDLSRHVSHQKDALVHTNL